MSLRTQINGFTAWVNLRLTPYNQLLNNVLMDLLSGTNMKYFVESFTGRDLKRLENMDGLSDQQRQTRVDWVIEELKKCKVIPEDVSVDSRLFAMRSSDHVFDLLWRLISHDIWFVWERAEYLQGNDFDVLTQVPFKWTPDPPPKKKKSKKQSKKSLLSGFGVAPSEEKAEDVVEEEDDDKEGTDYRVGHHVSWIDKLFIDYNKSTSPAIIPTKSDQIEITNEAEVGKKPECTNIQTFGDTGCNDSKTYSDNQDFDFLCIADDTLETESSNHVDDKTKLHADISHDIESSADDDINRRESNKPSSPAGCDWSEYSEQVTADQDSDNDSSTETKPRNLVSIYIIPLKDAAADDDDEEASFSLVKNSVTSDMSDNRSDQFLSAAGDIFEEENQHGSLMSLNSETWYNDFSSADLGQMRSSSKVSMSANDHHRSRRHGGFSSRNVKSRSESAFESTERSLCGQRDSLKVSLKQEGHGRSKSVNGFETMTGQRESLKVSLKQETQGRSKSVSTLQTMLKNIETPERCLSAEKLSRSFEMPGEDRDWSSQRLPGKSESNEQGHNLHLFKEINRSRNSLKSPLFDKCKEEARLVTSQASMKKAQKVKGRINDELNQTGSMRERRNSVLDVITTTGHCDSPDCIFCRVACNERPGANAADDDEKWDKFPNAEYVKAFKKKKRSADDYPTPDACILEMINYQLKITRDGKGLYCYSIDDFVDSRVLCALVNSFVPNTFTADLLLNDRWTINLALKTAEKMFYAETPFEAEDLVEADPMAVCAYFAFFFMVAYRYRQTIAVVDRVDFINMLIRECNHDLEKFPPIISNMQELQRRKDLKQQLDKHRQALENLTKKFDVDFSRRWVQHVEHVQIELRREIREKMRQRFEIVEIPRNITINDFCLAAVINLSLTNGTGFYLTASKESLGEGRKLVLKNRETEEFIEDFTNRSKATIKDTLHLPDVPGQVLEIMPTDYPQYDFYFEAPSRNKQLKTGTFFLYQVFPGNTTTWQRLFIKSSRDSEYETVEKMIMFFRDDSSFINCKEPKSGNTALHWACKMGHFDVVRLLLENVARIDIKNNFKCAPINFAVEALQRRICHYLIEWGCDVQSKNVKGITVLETVKNDDFKKYLMDIYDHYSTIVPKIMNGDMECLDEVIADHVAGITDFCCLRSRCINGSTLLHTACYYGHIPAIKDLLSERVDVNLRDYKGATPLHRAKNPDILELLLDAGAHVNAEDLESNTPLHVKCYGESNQPSELEGIQMLLNKNASMTIRNSRGLMPIHCCAMQGRVDVMQLMMAHDKHDTIARALSKEDLKKPPSLLHLAIANDFPDCAKWLIANSFHFKEKEQDILLRRVLTEQIKLVKRAETVKFLLDNGADPNPRYPGSNTALHYAAGLSGPSDVLELLVAFRAEIDAINEEGCTPLFFATQSNNKFAACVLIDQNANVRQKNSQGMTAFDYIIDFEEWIECGYFDDEVKARLKAYNLKHARDLIRAISKRVKPTNHLMMRQELSRSTYAMQSPGIHPHYRIPSSPMPRHSVLPSIKTGDTGKKFIMF